ncbi:serine/threonine protein kinase [Streptomyces ambofaciens]|uniref:Serine/threonine protein kinase n=1 Tax=Streptomyces ambofaciens TaxID=1889 RepID=A0ABM6B2C4_STRAM|nr:serine/threonine-protein kinase [Streptomyces ambofaciens]ANB07826.1 serine/threonine protein kinase [Streptomyces ambofaciens]
MNGDNGFDLAGSGAGPLEDADPRRIGPVPLVGRLGAGGMGRVYLGVHEGRYAAVKQVLASVAAEDKAFLRRFGHELDNLARLPAGATAPLLLGDRDARPPWFATAYVPGITLREAVGLHGPLPAGALWLVLREAATALAAVHALDMVHRDLKPSNAMLTLDGLTLIDFGIARAAGQSDLTSLGKVVGTPAYMSPEQASGKRVSGGAVDVFALGSLIAYAASGRPPFGDESGHAVLYRIVHEEPDLQPLRELDAELAEVVAACLDKDHEGRPTAAELAETAERHGPFTAPRWPEAVNGLLAERAAFAAKAPGPVHVPEPEEAAPSPPSLPVVAGGRPEKREQRRRTKVLALVIPVVVTGTTLGFTLLPYAMDDDKGGGKGADAGAPPAVTGTSTPGPTGSATASTGPSASASGSPDGKKDEKEEGEKEEGEKGGNGSGDAAAVAGASGGGPVATGAASGAGGADGSGGSSGSGESSGSSGGSGSADGDSQGGGSAADTFMLKNGSSGKCMYVGTPIDDGNCSGDIAVFRFQSTSGGAFRLLNLGTAQCIHARSANAWLVRAACGQMGGEWKEGSNGSLRNLTTGGCLDLNRRASMIGLTTTTCTGSASQRWTRI